MYSVSTVKEETQMPNIHDTILPEVRAAGRKAFRDGKTLADCPSDGPTAASRALNRRNWLHGFLTAEHKEWTKNFKAKAGPGVRLPRNFNRLPVLMAALR